MGSKRPLTETRFINTVEDFDQLEDAMLSTERDVAKKLNIKPCTLRNERLQGAISFVKIRSRYFYTEEQVEEYLRSKTSRLTMPRQPPTNPTPSERHISPTPLDELRNASRAAVLRSAMETFKRGPRSPNRRKDG